MKTITVLLFGILFLAFGFRPLTGIGTIAPGEQPQISEDDRGVIRIVFGVNDRIYCSTSDDQGNSFSRPHLVAEVPQMHLGMSRGPQLASSGNYSIITAMDRSGNIHCFRLKHGSDDWQSLGTINDLKGSCPEGLMSIAADKKDDFYAVWLDSRTGNHNQIYFAYSADNATHWSKNAMVYRSPDGHVCECCKPAISARGAEIAIMFRNWLKGSRDLYLLRSSDKGRSFRAAQKLGTGTWKLNGCPMDGGGVSIDQAGEVRTVWQREGTVYYCKPGEQEKEIDQGKICSITGAPENGLITMQKKDTLKLIRLPQQSEMTIGRGSFMKAIPLPGNKTLCVWEQDKVIKYLLLAP